MLQYVFASECRQAVFKIIQVMIHPIQYILDLDPYKLILELNIDSSRVIQRILKKTKSLKKPSNKTWHKKRIYTVFKNKHIQNTHC